MTVSKWNKIFDIFFFIILIFLITFFLCGFRYNYVETGSMESVIHAHDHVIVKTIKEEDCKHLKASSYQDAKDGDIIVFQDYRQLLIIHRVIKNDQKNKVITTKGDNNNDIGEFEKNIPYKNIFYKYIVTIPRPWHLCLKLFFIIFIIINLVVFIYEYIQNKNNNLKN